MITNKPRTKRNFENQIIRNGGLIVALFSLLLTNRVDAQNVSFSTVDAGNTSKAITEWGIEVAWINSDNFRQSKEHMGADEIDVVFANFWPMYALTASGNLSAAAKAAIDNQIAAASGLPNAAWALGPSIEGTDSYYYSGSNLNTQRWHDLMEATKDYIESASGKSVIHVMPFNEADYWAGQGTPTDLKNIAQLIADNPNFNGIGIMGPSTLSSYVAQNDYTVAKGPLTHGTTHQLQTWGEGSANSTAAFYQYVASQGDTPYAPELHSLGEAVFSAQYGVTGGAWWADVRRARGLFVRSCQGARLAYAENRPNSSAAAVYRAPDGQLYGFAGCFERMGISSPYRFVSTDRDVYFNGIGPMREYTQSVTVDQDAYVDIDYDTDIIPALDGHRWKIFNRSTGRVLEVYLGQTTDGANIRTDVDQDLIKQKWDILRTRDGYYKLYCAKSGKPADLDSFSLSNGANIMQWSDTGSLNQYWFLDDAGGGYYYIRNGHSNKYLTSATADAYQWEYTGAYDQQWQFVLADSAGSGVPVAHYEFEGNANDSAGSNDGMTSGSPVYTSGPVGFGQAIDLDGSNDYVDLPDNICDSDDITIAAWVKWDGNGGSGLQWQRIFDFGLDTDTYMFLSPYSSDGMMEFSITTSGYLNEESIVTTPISLGQWVHLAVTLRGNTGILYVDGVPQTAGFISLNPSDVQGGNGQNNYIGKSQWPDPLFNGQIDDFHIFDYALTADEVAALAGVTPSTPPSTPTGLSAVSADEEISLVWTSASNATGYAVKYALSPGGPYDEVGTPTATSFVHSGLTNGITYYYVVAASGDGGVSDDSDEVSAVPSAPITPEEYYITDMAVDAGTNVTLTVSNSVPGHTYGMLAADDLTSPTVWSNIMNKAGSGTDLLFGIPISPESTNRFFMLDVQRQ